MTILNSIGCFIIYITFPNLREVKIYKAGSSVFMDGFNNRIEFSLT